MPRLAKEKIDKIHELAKSGKYTYKSIAEQVGCTAATAKKYAEQVKLQPISVKKQPTENPSKQRRTGGSSILRDIWF